ncbi:MAG: hypothetical protein R3234_13675 [Thermoanaerobaculia bacterium]|nr:hypothetical protein [Thermoanaerobaculia bacterium]
MVPEEGDGGGGEEGGREAGAPGSPVPLHLVVALMPEARPLIEAWSLRPEPGSGELRRFRNQRCRLVVTGIGREAATRGTEALTAESGKGPAIWLNVGLCGHRSLPVGEIRIAHKVVDREDGESLFPPQIVSSPWPPVELHTVHAPELEYADEVAYDMEAAGFLRPARSSATAELVQCVKVVSDNRERPARRLRDDEIRALMEPVIPGVRILVERLRKAASDLARDLLDRKLMDRILDRTHFTVSRRRSLEKLLRRMAAREIPVPVGELTGDAAEILETLKRRLAEEPVRLDR